MKSKIILALIFVFMAAFPAYSNQPTFHKVLKIVDGDTFYVDFNDNGKIEKREKIRINGIDSFETKINPRLNLQTTNQNLTQKEALWLGFLGREFARKELLNKKVQIVFSAPEKTDKYNRNLVSIYYDFNKNNSKSYEQEILKSGLALVYENSNLKEELKPYENIEKLKQNTIQSKNIELVFLNTRSKKYHKLNCPNVVKINYPKLIKEPKFKYKKARCCYKENDE